jgi:hypothetical protein
MKMAKIKGKRRRSKDENGEKNGKSPLRKSRKVLSINVDYPPHFSVN